jgi:hypothetical protein
MFILCSICFLIDIVFNPDVRVYIGRINAPLFEFNSSQEFKLNPDMAKLKQASLLLNKVIRKEKNICNLWK